MSTFPNLLAYRYDRREFIVLQFSCPDFSREGFVNREISKGICDKTCSEICHVDMEIDGKLIGAHMPDGIQERDPAYEVWGKRIRVYVPATKLQKAAYESYVRSMIGTPYDLKSIFGIALNSNLHDQGHLICSAFGKLAVDDKPPCIVIVRKTYYLTSPEDLRIAASATYGAIEQRVEGNGSIPPLALAAGASA
jgi:hypothetical protein